MLPAKRLLFIECPPQSTDIGTWIFQKMGFDVEVHQILCSKLDSILDIKSSSELACFDAIVISSRAFVSRSLLERFMELVRMAETKKSSRILVVGMNRNISDEEQKTQEAVFDGMFVGKGFNEEQVREMFRGLIDQ
jgi:methylmalonyl-CoA mutase cobalamin-binding subunit